MWFSLYWFFLLWLFLRLLLHLSMRWKFDFNFFRWTMFCSFLWKHPRRRAELEERNSGIDAGMVWMDEFLKFKQIRYCRGQGQDRSWILDVLTGQVFPMPISIQVSFCHKFTWVLTVQRSSNLLWKKNWTSMQVLNTSTPTQTPCPRPPMGQKTRPSCNSFEGS